MFVKDRWVLPEGVEETLPAEAGRIERLRRSIIDLFGVWGYDLVMPPLIEFMESLLTGVGQDMDVQTFKLTDQLTGRLMGVRPDITPQAARIDAHYLKRHHAVRLCYIGPVLRTRPDAFGGSREPLQLGAELFGHAGPESDAEVLSLMLATLELANIERPHIDLAHVGVFRALARMAGLDPERETQLFDVVQRKAKSDVAPLLAAAGVAPTIGAMIAALLELNGGPEVLARARSVFAPAGLAVHAAMDNLEAIARHVQAQTPQAEICFDLAELGGYHYYTGVMFAAFVPGFGSAIAKGGRYDGIGQAFGRDRAATGFGADLRLLLRAGTASASQIHGILAPALDDSGLTQEIARLRAEGERVVRRLPGDSATAADLDCDRELKQKSGRWIVENTK